MTAFSPPAARRRLWLDPRILVGVLLVLASVAGVVALVAARDRSTVVYVAAESLAAGTRVTDSEVRATSVRLGGAQDLYLAGRLPSAGFVVTRPIARGEIVPLSALGTTAGESRASVVVPLTTKPAAGLGSGASVDLWAAPKNEARAGSFGAPVLLVAGAQVVALTAPEGVVTAGQPTSVELRVPRDQVAAVLEAVAGADALSAVSVGEPVRR